MCLKNNLEVRIMGDQDVVSRLLEQPGMVRNWSDLAEWHWDRIFRFDSDTNRTESLIWRVILPLDDQVHQKGIAFQDGRRARGKDCLYVGFASGIVGAIRNAKTTKGHYFEVSHKPSEGEEHAHIRFCEKSSVKIRQQDKWDAYALMKQIFNQHTSYSSSQ